MSQDIVIDNLTVLKMTKTTAKVGYLEYFNPLSPSVKMQNLLTGIHTISYGNNWENFFKDHVAISGDHVLDSHYLYS